jgi:hypothetical protein
MRPGHSATPSTIALIAILSAQLMVVLDFSIVNVAVVRENSSQTWIALRESRGPTNGPAPAQSSYCCARHPAGFASSSEENHRSPLDGSMITSGDVRC